jgi:hypothetical protein
MMVDDDVDFIAIQKIITFFFGLDMIGPAFAAKPRKFVDEARFFPEGAQRVLRPIDRVFLTREIHDRFGERAVRAVMDYPIFTLH